MSDSDAKRKVVNAVFGFIVFVIGVELIASHQAANQSPAAVTAPAPSTGGALIDASTGHDGQRSDSARRADVATSARNDCKHPSASRLRRFLADHPEWTDDDIADVACHLIHIGMNAGQVRAAWGPPQSVNSSTYAFGQSEQWVYGSGSYVYLDDGVVTSLQQSR